MSLAYFGANKRAGNKVLGKLAGSPCTLLLRADNGFFINALKKEFFCVDLNFLSDDGRVPRLKMATFAVSRMPTEER